MRGLVSLLLFTSISLFANYQSTYIPDQVKKDFSEQNYGKYQVDTIPTVSLAELKSKGVFNANATLTKHITAKTPNFNAIVAADVCKVDNKTAYSSTIYETDLAIGVVTCMYAVKGNLYNPIGLYKVTIPEVKAYYAINTDAAKIEKAGEIGKAEAQFTPLLQKKKDMVAEVGKGSVGGFLTIPELLMAAVLTDDEIIDIEATRATGKFQLKPGYTSKFSNSAEVVDESEYILADAATIFDVYTGLSGVSMAYLMILVVGFGAYGGIRFIGGMAVEKYETKGSSDKKTPFVVGIAAGVLLFFPVNQGGMGAAAGEAGEYELLKTRYQGFEKFGYYTFSEWGKAAAKVIIDAETGSLIRKSGLGAKDQIVNNWAQKVQSDKLSDFYINNYNLCLNNIYLQDKLVFDDGKGVYSETDKGLFPSSESWAAAADLGKPMTDGYYDLGDRGVLREGAAAIGEYPKFAFSACGKADYLSNYHKDRQERFIATSTGIASTSGEANTAKLDMMGGIFKFQYELYRDWGYLAILGLPVTRMQTESIGGLYKTGESEVMEKLHKQNGTDTVMHSLMSTIPYLFVPGAGTVFTVVNENAGKIGGAIGAAAGTTAAGAATLGVFAWLGALAGGAVGTVAATSASGALAMFFAYSVAKAVLTLAPIVALVAIGLLRFIIIILKIFSFHFLSLFMMPIMFLKENVRGIATFSAKILATMLEIPVFVLSIWLAVTANSLIHTIGTVFSKNIVGGMLMNNDLGHDTGGMFDFMPDGEMLGMLRIYVFDGFMEVIIAVFSIVVVYKIIISLHTSLFEMLDIQTSHTLDNSIESMKNETSGWGARI